MALNYITMEHPTFKIDIGQIILHNHFFGLRSCRFSLGARLIRQEDAIYIIEAWLTATFQGERHLRRIGKIADYENQ